MQKKITINGKEYPFWLNLNSIDALKQNHKIDLLGAGLQFSDTKSIVKLTLECLKEGGVEIEEKELRKILGLREIKAITTIVVAEIAGEEVEGNPPTPQKEG